MSAVFIVETKDFAVGRVVFAVNRTLSRFQNNAIGIWVKKVLKLHFLILWALKKGCGLNDV